MTVLAPARAIPKLADHCPEFVQAWSAYERAVEAEEGVDQAYAAVQLVAGAFASGAQYARDTMAAAVKSQLVDLTDEGALGPITARRVMKDLGVTEA